MKPSAVSLFLLLGATTAAAGCAIDNEYEAPDEPVGQQMAPPVASYPVPAQDPKGALHVMVTGTERLPAGPGQPDTYLHVRLAAENTSDTTAWTLDPNDQVLTFGGGTLAASFAESSAGGPVATIEKGARAALDVYYPVPATSDPSQVSLSWHVRRGSERFPGTTAIGPLLQQAPAYGSEQGGGYAPNSYGAYDTNPYATRTYVGVGLGWWWWPELYPWWYRPYWGFGYYPRYYWGGGYYGRGYYGGGGGRYVPPARAGGNWRTPSAPSTQHSSPPSGGSSRSGGGGGGGWRGGGRR